MKKQAMLYVVCALLSYHINQIPAQALPISELEKAQPIFAMANNSVLAQRFGTPIQPIKMKAHQNSKTKKHLTKKAPSSIVTTRFGKENFTSGLARALEMKRISLNKKIAQPTVGSFLYKQQQIQNSLNTKYLHIINNPKSNSNELADALQHFSRRGLQPEIQNILQHKNANNIREYILLDAVENIAYYGYNDLVQDIIKYNPKVKRSMSKFLGKALQGAAGAGDTSLVSWIVQQPQAKKINQKDIQKAEATAKYYNFTNVAQQLSNMQKKN